MANYQRDAAKEAYWRDVLRRQRSSGLSVRAFCQRERLAESAFHAWRRTIAQRDGQAASTRTEPIDAVDVRNAVGSASAAFVPVAVTEFPASEPPMVLELAGGRRLRLPATFSIQRLAQLIGALEAGGPR